MTSILLWTRRESLYDLDDQARRSRLQNAMFLNPPLEGQRIGAVPHVLTLKLENPEVSGRDIRTTHVFWGRPKNVNDSNGIASFMRNIGTAQAGPVKVTAELHVKMAMLVAQASDTRAYLHTSWDQCRDFIGYMRFSRRLSSQEELQAATNFSAKNFIETALKASMRGAEGLGAQLLLHIAAEREALLARIDTLESELEYPKVR